MTSKIFFIAFKLDKFSMKIYIVVTDVVNDVAYPCKSVNTRGQKNINYMMLSPGKQYDKCMSNHYCIVLSYDEKPVSMFAKQF